MLHSLVLFFFFLMIRRPPRSTLSSSSAASDVYKRQGSGSGSQLAPAVTSLASALGPNEQHLDKLLTPVINRCGLELRSPGSRVAECCARVAGALAGASAECCQCLINELLPGILTQLSDASCTDPVVLLGLVQHVARAVRVLGNTKEIEKPPLLEQDIRDQLIAVALAAASCQEPAARADAGANLLAELAANSSLFPNTQDDQASELFIALFQSVESCPEDRSGALILAATQNQEGLIRSGVLSRMVCEGGQIELGAQLCIQQQVWEQCFSALVNLFESPESGAMAARGALLCCETFLKTGGANPKHGVLPVLAAVQDETVLAWSDRREQIGQMLGLVSELAAEHCPEEAAALNHKLASMVQGQQLDHTLALQRPELLPALAAVVARTQHQPGFCTALPQVAKDESQPELVRAAARRILCLVINWCPEMYDQFEFDSLTEPDTQVSMLELEVRSSMLRGLVLKADKRAIGLARQLIQTGISSPEVPGDWTSQLFGQLMVPCLGNEMSQGFLWQQRFFSGLVPLLVEGCDAGDGDDLAASLGVLGALAPSVPTQVVINESERLMPLVRAGIDHDSPEVREVAVRFLLAVLTSSPATIQPELPSLLPKLLALCLHSENGVAATGRVGALAALEELLKLPFPVIYPFKPQVLAATLEALDDPKYIVRKAAVKCRNKWTFSRVS
eukprot:TRINITY_DN25845_c0_g1_i5.p1 TRINITY_DN25845_c0_g1~~TRINITY_DN25845_c0_g1_i5.p1  ORF type:complete len:681 (-),score=173.46 TRINITY_DN25845_c0_g1_i5:232-2274(-)